MTIVALLLLWRSADELRMEDTGSFGFRSEPQAMPTVPIDSPAVGRIVLQWPNGPRLPSMRGLER